MRTFNLKSEWLDVWMESNRTSWHALQCDESCLDISGQIDFVHSPAQETPSPDYLVYEWIQDFSLIWYTFHLWGFLNFPSSCKCHTWISLSHSLWTDRSVVEFNVEVLILHLSISISISDTLDFYLNILQFDIWLHNITTAATKPNKPWTWWISWRICAPFLNSLHVTILWNIKLQMMYEFF